MDTTTPAGTPAVPPGGLYAMAPGVGRRADAVLAVLDRRGVRADALTWAGLLAAACCGAAVVAGAAVAPSWWLLVLPLGLLRLLLAVLDGRLARRTGTARPAGALLGEVGDRLGDVLILGALAAVDPLAGALAVVAALLADDVATVGWAVTGVRRFPAVGGKPDRTALVGVGLLLASAVPAAAPGVAWAAVALSTWNAAARLSAIRRASAGVGR
jgi:CDP-diacylglycerol---glycerol-3-phosphate 3-phosphatidyltransferase